MLHTSTLYLIESQIELAEKIAGLSGIPMQRSSSLNSGTEANDAALMLATTYKQSNQVLAIRGAITGSRTPRSRSPGRGLGRGRVSRPSRSPMSTAGTSSAAHSAIFPTRSSSQPVLPT